MPKERTTPEAAAASFGVGKLTRHLFLCTGPDCVASDAGQASWDYLKRRLKELGLSEQGGVLRTKANCLRICEGGPVALVYRASWPDETIVRGVLADIEAHAAAAPMERTALILVGPSLASEDFRESALYAADYDRRFRSGGANVAPTTLGVPPSSQG